MTLPTDHLFPSVRWLQMLSGSSQRSSDLHRQVLEIRQNGLKGIEALIALQVQAGAGQSASHPIVFQPPAVTRRPAIITSQQIDAFGTGRISDCLGPEFKIYDDRRMPRIPNGDLKMMSRVVAIKGKARQFTQLEEIEVEYDVDPAVWYFKDVGSQQIPTGLIMEIALQPCGFLSAYLDSYSLLPSGEYYFRNLDGNLRYLSAPALAGKTVSTHARLITNIVSSGTIIQKFEFRLSCDGEPFADGESIFGVFMAQAMANQIGLDGGKTDGVPQQLSHSGGGWENLVELQRSISRSDGLHLPTGQLNMLGDVRIEPNGGRYGKGSVYARRTVDPQDWFFTYHFFQDPVMPGSLGIEAVLQAMQVYALKTRLGSKFHAPRFTAPVGSQPMSWRYRGQITRQHREMELVIDIRDIQEAPDRITVTGDASVWVDNLRIYEVRGAVVCIAG